MTDISLARHEGRIVVNAAARAAIVFDFSSLATGTNAGSGGTATGGGASGGTTTQPPPAPGKVTNLRIDRIDGTTVYYSWDAYAGAAQYRGEVRARDGAAATDTWTGIATTTGTSESKGGLPNNTTYEFRVLALSGTTVLAVSDSVTVVLGTPAVAGTGAGTGTGTGSTGGGSTTSTSPPVVYTGTIEALRLTAAVPTLPVPLRVKAEEAYTRPPVCCGFAFGPSDVPAGSRIRLRTAAGAEVPFQQDEETHWPDGSLKFCVGSFVAPDTFATGQTISYTVDAVSGTPDRTASYTLDQVKNATDFRLEVKGCQWGNAVGVLRVNEVIASGKIGSWGVNPKLGAEVIASGPIRQEWLFWAIAKRASDGALHESVLLELYARRWTATGAWEFIGRQRQPSFDAAFYGSTWSTTGWRNGNHGYAECFDGTTRVWACGGPNDRDARTVPANQFDAGASLYTVPVDQNLGQVSAIDGKDGPTWYGMGVPFGMSGALPGGTSPNAPYWLSAPDGARKAGLRNARNRQGDSENFVIFTGGATGDVTVFPLIGTYPGTGVVMADEQSDPFWVGPGARPRVRVGHDEAYLTRASRLFAPMDLSLPRPAQPVPDSRWPYHPYRPNQVLGDQWWDWGKEGDDFDKDRVGWLSRQHANLLLTPFDKLRRTHCFALAYMQNDVHFDWSDQRSNRIVVGNNGPNSDGVTYPEMGPVMPTLYMTQRDDHGALSANPGFNAMAYYNKGGSGYDRDNRYGPIGEASHYPSWQIVPYLLSGHRVHLDLMRTNTALMFVSHDGGRRGSQLAPPQVPRTRRFYNIFFDQARGMGWSRLALSNLRHVLPDGHPERPYLDDVAEQNSTYWSAVAPYSPFRLFGGVPIAPPDGNMDPDVYTRHAEYMSEGRDKSNVGFQNIYQLLGSLFCMYRGESGYKAAVDVYLAYLRDAADDRQYPNGTGFFSNQYFTWFVKKDSNGEYFGDYFQTRSEWIRVESADGQFGPHVSPPYPADSTWGGNFHAYGDPKADPGPGGFGTAYIVQHTATLALAAWLANPDGSAMFPDCDRVRLDLINRVIAHPDNLPARRDRFPLSSNSYPNEMGSQWSLLPPGL